MKITEVTSVSLEKEKSYMKSKMVETKCGNKNNTVIIINYHNTVQQFTLTFREVHVTGFVFGFVGCDEVLLKATDGSFGGLDEVDSLEC